MCRARIDSLYWLISHHENGTTPVASIPESARIMNFDVVIVGSGLAGQSVALHLAKPAA